MSLISIIKSSKFVDKDPESSAMLKQRLSKYEKTKRLEFRSSDANLQIEIPIYWL